MLPKRSHLPPIEQLGELQIPQSVPVRTGILAPTLKDALAFVRDVIGKMLIGRGDQIPVSALPVDGTFPTGTSRWEKRNIAQEVPVWEPDLCIQCGKCVMVCPHAVIRSKVYDSAILKEAPATFKSREARRPEWKGLIHEILNVNAGQADAAGVYAQRQRVADLKRALHSIERVEARRMLPLADTLASLKPRLMMDQLLLLPIVIV